jgi:hypothetical protein
MNFTVEPTAATPGVPLLSTVTDEVPASAAIPGTPLLPAGRMEVPSIPASPAIPRESAVPVESLGRVQPSSAAIPATPLLPLGRMEVPSIPASPATPRELAAVPPTKSGSGNSGSGNSGSDGSSDGSGSNTSSSVPSGTSPIDGLTTNLKQITDSGPPDIKLSEETQKNYVNLIKGFINDLQTQRAAMDKVPAVGNPGTLTSAIQTEKNLDLDVNGPGGVIEMTDKYLTYLNDFVDTVNKAASRLIQSG